MTMNLKIKIAALVLLIAIASIQVISRSEQTEEQTIIHQMMPE